MSEREEEYVLVPREPTEKMIDAAAAGTVQIDTITALVGDNLPWWHALAKYHYKKMLSAAPPAPVRTADGWMEECAREIVGRLEHDHYLDERIAAIIAKHAPPTLPIATGEDAEGK